MKTKCLLTLALIILALAYAFASDDKYTESMQKNIQSVYTAQSIPDLQTAVNAFDRIAAAEKTKWEPFYYAGFGNLMMANRESDAVKKDAYLDLALKSIEKAKTIAPSESEIVALEGFVHMIRVTVDPKTRGQQYSGMAYQSFGKARSMDPENPRALVLTAQMEFGTAKFFGSSTSEACKTLATAIEKFSTYKTTSALSPQWGKGMADDLTAQCK